MAVESGSNVNVSYVAEVTHGTTPGSPTMKPLRLISRNMNPNKNPLISAELRADRLGGQSRHGFRSVTGSFGYELSLVDQDDMIEAALGGTWAAVTGTATATESTNQAGKTYTRSTGSYLTDGLLPGDTVTKAGFVNTASNGQKTVAALTATVMTVIEAIGANESAVAAISTLFPGKRLKVGTTLRTFTFERRFPTITQFQVFRGVAVNQMSLSITPEAIVTGTYDLIGMDFAALSATSLGAPAAAGTNAPFNGFLGALYENSIAMGLITAITLQIANSRTVAPVLFAFGSPDVYDGPAEVTGSVTVQFQDATMFNKFVNETTSSLNLRMDDLTTTGFLRVFIPSLLYTGSPIDPPASGPVTIAMPFRANPDSVSGTNLMFQRSNV